MPEIVENGNTNEEPRFEEIKDHVNIETLKHAAKLESANLIAAERGGNDVEIPTIEVETAPPAEEPDHYQSNGNGVVDNHPPEPSIFVDEHKESENGYPVEHQNGNTETQNEEPVTIKEPVLICPIDHPLEPELIETPPHSPAVPEQPDLICPMVRKEEPEPEPEVYREPVVCEMKAKFTEPKVEKMSPMTNGAGAKKGALNTKLDIASLKNSYEAVRSDQDETEWAVFKFDGPTLTTSTTGTDFSTFQKQFGEAERAFAYIRIQTGDEMSKRQKFILVTWIGPDVSVLQRAKMSTDKSFVKTIVSNFAVELQPETSNEINLEHFVAELDKAGGAHYGTGV